MRKDIKVKCDGIRDAKPFKVFLLINTNKLHSWYETVAWIDEHDNHNTITFVDTARELHKDFGILETDRIKYYRSMKANITLKCMWSEKMRTVRILGCLR